MKKRLKIDKVILFIVGLKFFIRKVEITYCVSFFFIEVIEMVVDLIGLMIYCRDV